MSKPKDIKVKKEGIILIKLEGKKGSGNKVKEENFSPCTCRLAIASKNYMRELTAVQDPFPLKNDDDREEYLENYSGCSETQGRISSHV